LRPANERFELSEEIIRISSKEKSCPFDQGLGIDDIVDKEVEQL
jgi:hypothetical protein